MSWAQLQQRLPGGVSSPVRAFRHVGMEPCIATAGEGALIRDSEGRSYIDYCCGWGALLHGHAHPRMLEAVERRLRDGWIFGLANGEEAQLAEKISSWMPSLEMVRFLATGTEAAMTATRIARAATGRDKIIKFGGHYHGHHESFLIEAGSAATEMTVSGIPESWLAETICLPFNDLEALQLALAKHSIAAVIVEPIATNMGLVGPAPQFLQELRRLTQQHGTLLIFDEIVTGCRLSRSGAQGVYQVTPDLTLLSKVIGGGFPLALVGGPRHLMQLLAPVGNVFQAGTFAGHPVAVTAGSMALELASHPAFFPELEASVRRLTDPLQQWLEQRGAPAVIQRAGPLFSIFLGRRSFNASYETLNAESGGMRHPDSRMRPPRPYRPIVASSAACDTRAPHRLLDADSFVTGVVTNGAEARSIDRPLYAQLFRSLLSQGILAPPSPFECWYVSSAHTPAQLDATRDALQNFFTDTF